MEYSHRKRRRTIVLLIIGVLSVLLATGFAVTEVSAQEATINSCTVIDSAGTYQLTTDLRQQNAQEPCIEITASNVVLDGGGHTIAGPTVTPTGTGIDGIHVNGTSANPSRNVTAENFTTVGWSNGTNVENAEDTTLRNITARSTVMNGIRLASWNDSQLTDITFANITEEERNIPGGGRGLSVTLDSANNTLTDITFRNTKYSFLLDGGSQDNQISNVAATGTTYVVYLYAADDNVFQNITSTDNHRWSVYAEQGATGNTFTNTTLSGPTMNFQPTGIGIRPVPGPGFNSSPEPPADQHAVGPHVEVSATQINDPGSINITMPYQADDPNASATSIWWFANESQDNRNASRGTWMEIGSDVDSEVDTVRTESVTLAPLNAPDVSSGVFVPLAPGIGPETSVSRETETPFPTEMPPTAQTTPTTVTETAPGETTEMTRVSKTKTTIDTATATETTIEMATETATAPKQDGEGQATEETTTTTGTGPGFGLLVTLGALLAMGLLVRRSQ